TSMQATRAPASVRATAQARPMPAPAPASSTRFPARPSSIIAGHARRGDAHAGMIQGRTGSRQRQHLARGDTLGGAVALAAARQYQVRDTECPRTTPGGLQTRSRWSLHPSPWRSPSTPGWCLGFSAKPKLRARRDTMADVRIKTLKDGPYEVKGAIQLVDAKRAEFALTEDPIYL